MDELLFCLTLILQISLKNTFYSASTLHYITLNH